MIPTRHIQVAFYKASKGSIKSKAISWYTTPLKHKFSKKSIEGYSHVEIFIPSLKLAIGAIPEDGFVTIKNVDYTNDDKWLLSEHIPISLVQYVNIMQILLDRIGAKYDWLGILGFLLTFIRDRSNKWFCSELVVDLFQHIDLYDLKSYDPAKISPNKLYQLLKSKDVIK